MEMLAAERIWLRSEYLGFRYTILVSDGDSKTFFYITYLKPYPDEQIQEVKCLNHVAKRLGNRPKKKSLPIKRKQVTFLEEKCLVV